MLIRKNINEYRNEYRNLIILALIGIPIGIITGLADVSFATGLAWVTAFREAHFYWCLPFLPLGGLVIVLVRNRLKKLKHGGINLCFAVGLGEETRIPLRLIPFAIISTWLTHLLGGSAGREGVALQIGATVSNRIGRKLPIKNATEVFLITGFAAGFAGLFITPIAAVLFAVEVLIAGEIEYKAFLPALSASFSAALTSRFLGLEKQTYIFDFHPAFSCSNVLKLLALGIIFGICGSLFSFVFRHTKAFSEKYISNDYLRIFIAGAFLSFLLMVFKGRYCGVGSSLIENVFAGQNIYAYDWILKLVFTVCTLVIGFQGGEIMPLFSVGACLGCFVAPYFGLPAEFVAGLGFASVFGAATNTFFAPMFIGAEIFGFQSLPYFFAVCAIAYFCNLNRSVYSLQQKKDDTK